jgi:hypothetical protein
MTTGRATMMVRDLASKLKITAALLGCASQKDFCARFHEVNPQTAFHLDRSYKWMQGRAQPRSAGVYEDWATLLGTANPISHLQSCTVDEFLDLVCDDHKMSRDALAARAGVVVGSEAMEFNPIERLPGRHLAGAYACYSHAWSPYFQGKIIRGSLVIETAAHGTPALVATYAEAVAFGRLRLRGPLSIVNRSVYVDLLEPTGRFRLGMCLSLPGTLANVVAGVMSGTTVVDTDPQPAATRIAMVRIPGSGVARLEASNRYIDAEAPLSSDLIALGVPVTAPVELDALLHEFLAADQPNAYLKVTATEYSRLTLAVDRLFIDSGAAFDPPIALPGAAVV